MRSTTTKGRIGRREEPHRRCGRRSCPLRCGPLSPRRHPHSLTGRRRRPRSDDGPAESRLLRAIAIKLAESKANRLDDGVLRDESRRPATLPLNRLAVISPFVSVMFPLGLILAAAAREQIATVSPPEERGEGWARAAEVISWAVASLVLIVPAVALAISTATTT